MRRILIVDDEQVVADTLQLIFEGKGFQARAAYSAESALTIAREFHPELLLCDITMPGRNGLELVSDVSRELPECKILVLTGYYTNIRPVRERALTLPREISLMTKPCQPDELVREARQLLAS